MIFKTEVFKYLIYFLFCYKYFEDYVRVQVAPPGIYKYTLSKYTC